MTSAEVDAYIAKSKRWGDEMSRLRPILMACGLAEQVKWRSPCFTHGQGRGSTNIAIFQESKSHLALMFFKGALLDDPDGILTEQGPDARSARCIEFRSVEDVDHLTEAVELLVAQAIEVERIGVKLGPPPEPRLARHEKSTPALLAGNGTPDQ